MKHKDIFFSVNFTNTPKFKPKTKLEITSMVPRKIIALYLYKGNTLKSKPQLVQTDDLVLDNKLLGFKSPKF